MKYKSKDTAISNIKQLFSNTSANVISIQDAYKAWGRDLEKTEGNKAWLSNKLIDLKYYKLVKPVYQMKDNKRYVLDKIQLTTEGKKALERSDMNMNGTPIFSPPHVPKPKIKEETKTETVDISFIHVMKTIAKLKKENPEYQFTFDIKLKET